MKLQPLADRVIVEPLDAVEKTAGGIYIPDTAKEKPQEGKVLAVGKGKVSDNGQVQALEVKVGDVAFWGAGQVLAIFFGRTPMSMGADPVPADRVNVVGRVVGDAARLRQVMNASTIRVERVETVSPAG